MPNRTIIPLTRRLGALEIIGAAAWYARDNAVSLLSTAGAGGLAFALALVAFFNRMTEFREGTPAAHHLPEIAAWGAVLAGLFIARGLGHWAAVDALAASLRGERKTPEAAWGAAARKAIDALCLTGFPAMAQWAGMVAVMPGLLALNRWGISLAAAVVEDLPASSALRRGRDLTRGSLEGMAVWGFLLVTWAILFVNVLMAGAMLPDFLRKFFGVNLPRIEAALSPESGLFLVAAAAATWAACDALRCISFAILYLNARIEREGGDLLSRLHTLRAGRRAAAAPEPVHA